MKSCSRKNKKRDLRDFFHVNGHIATVSGRKELMLHPLFFFENLLFQIRT
jgi:hypothetical protein